MAVRLSSRLLKKALGCFFLQPARSNSLSSSTRAKKTWQGAEERNAFFSTLLQRRSLALMVAGLGPCHDAFVGSSPRGDGHAAAGLLGLAAIPFAGLDQRKWSPL
jgi:hypothetical protein